MEDANDFLFTGARGFTRVRTLAPGLLHIDFAGHLDDEIYRVLRKVGDAQTWDGTGLVIFYDTTAMTGFEKSFRLKMMAWQAESHGRQFQYVLVRSSLVAAAITAATKVIGGGAQITSNRAKFTALLEEAVQNRRASAAHEGVVQARLPRL